MADTYFTWVENGRSSTFVFWSGTVKTYRIWVERNRKIPNWSKDGRNLPKSAPRPGYYFGFLEISQALSQSSDHSVIHFEQVSILFSICSVEISQINSLFCFSAPQESYMIFDEFLIPVPSLICFCKKLLHRSRKINSRWMNHEELFFLQFFLHLMYTICFALVIFIIYCSNLRRQE